MYINRWVDKETVVHIYNGMLLSHKNEHIWVRSDEVAKPRAYYAEWSKPERENQISYISAYVWNLERWYWWSYLQSSSGDADREQTDGHGGGRRGNDKWKEEHGIMCTTSCKIVGICFMIQGTQIGALWQPRGVAWRGRGIQDGGSREKGYMCTYGWCTLMYGINQHNIVK